MWKGKVPFMKDTGSLATYVSHWEEDKVKWMDSFIFEDTMRFTSFYRGRSAAGFVVTSQTTGKKYTVFLVDVEAILQHGVQLGGIVSGTWGFVKRGTNYGLSLDM
jgi:hypothetical protein